MALQQNLASLDYGITFNNVYYRILTFRVQRDDILSIKFNAFIDVAGFATTTPEIETKPIHFKKYQVDVQEIDSLSGSTIIEKSYKWLLTQPEFSGATSV